MAAQTDFKLRLGSAILFLLIATTFAPLVLGDHEDDITDNDMDIDNKNVLFMVFDGFRWDYLSRIDTPNFDRLIQNGVTADYVTSSFITKTFPAHYSLITGLHEESHGFVGNQMYDPVLDARWTISNQSKDPVWWNDGEPLWVTNQKQGFKSGVYNYPAQDVKIRGVYPTYTLPKYDSSLSNTDVIDLIIPLFANKSINLGVLYFGTMDGAGHTNGPNSELINPAIKECDDTIGYLIDQLESIDMFDKVNIIATADHGMTEVSTEETIWLDDYIDGSLYQYDENNPVYGLWPNDDENTDMIYNALVNAHPNLKVYKKADIPDRYRYKTHRRIAPILAVADEHWTIRRDVNDTARAYYKGNHGYDNALESMRILFVGHGPAFKKGHQGRAFTAVDFYPMMCHLLHINASPNNGSLETVMPLFSSANGILSLTSSLSTFVTIVCIIINYSII